MCCGEEYSEEYREETVHFDYDRIDPIDKMTF